MSGSCTICTHAEREKIDEALIAGKSIRWIEQAFKAGSRETIRRHKHHVLAVMRKYDETEMLAHAGNLKAKLQMREADLYRIQKQAELNKDLPVAISAIRELRQCHELLAKVSGELKPEQIAAVALNLDEETSKRIARTYLDRHEDET
jgi:trans-aconitate methyltransferase